MKKLIIYGLIAYAVWYFFLKDKMKPCCSSCAQGGQCEGTEALPENIQTGSEKGFFYDAAKSKWIKVKPTRFIDDDLTSF